MSDTVLKLIPSDPAFVPQLEAQRKAVELLERILPEGEEWEAEVFPRLEFIDQGENLESIICPRCGRTVKVGSGREADPLVEWWYGVSDVAQENGYEGFTVKMPCCNQAAVFTELTFNWPAGFARFELRVSNPQIGGPLPIDRVSELSCILGCELRQVWAHY